MVADRLTGFSLAGRDHIGTKKDSEGPLVRSKCPSLALGYPGPLGKSGRQPPSAARALLPAGRGGTWRSAWRARVARWRMPRFRQ